MSHNSILNPIYFLFRYSGISKLFRKIFAQRNITIIVYHKPEVDFFRKHINYLNKKFHFISLSDLLAFFYGSKPSTMPEYALLITFDDGWKENFRLIDILTEFRIRPIIFLSSHLVNTYRNFWFTVCNKAEIKRLKKMATHQRLSDLSIRYDYYQEKEFPENRQVLNLDEIQKMKDLVDFGSHSSFHPILTKCNQQEKENEINGSLEKLEELLGIPVTSFAYPNGDYDQELVEILKAGNIKIARTTDAGWNNRSSNPFGLKVTGVSDNASIDKLAFELTGLSRYIQHLFNGSFNGTKPVN
jgi:peptidoglycan/xylan/chitin deacetylase (PgdA/CDA1 family)